MESYLFAVPIFFWTFSLSLCKQLLIDLLPTLRTKTCMSVQK
jgi:hypothetical protein